MSTEVIKGEYVVFDPIKRKPEYFKTKGEAINALEAIERMGYYGELQVKEVVRVSNWRNLKTTH